MNREISLFDIAKKYDENQSSLIGDKVRHMKWERLFMMAIGTISKKSGSSKGGIDPFPKNVRVSDSSKLQCRNEPSIGLSPCCAFSSRARRNTVLHAS